VAGLVVYALVAYRQPLPTLSVVKLSETPIATYAPVLTWPGYGESAVGAIGYGVLATHGNNTGLPTASVGKMMTTLAVLKRYPLTIGQQGPTITLAAADVNSYNTYAAEGGSVIKVISGEKITEYQALEAMLLPSANNMADTLATWAYGSMNAYIINANQIARSLGLNNSYFSDASGFAPQTVSTAHDLVVLGEAVMANPVIAQIVAQKSAVVPVAGTVDNVNWLLDSNGIDGIKTGSTGSAGGVYLFSSQQKLVNGQAITVVGSIMDGPTLQRAMDDAVPLIQSVMTNFQITTVISAGQVVGYYHPGWSGRIEAVADATLAPVTWPGQSLVPNVQFNLLHTPLAKGVQVGTASVTGITSSSVPIIMQEPLNSPPWYWRLLHI
jgi:D-alanyl-D-alanine carboxypeptidase (penicillin-binding protein 5/6)